MEQFVIWNRYKINDNLFIDPNPNYISNNITFIEYNYRINENTLLGKIIGEQLNIDEYITNNNMFNIIKTTSEEFLPQLTLYYSNYSVKSGNTNMFEIIDNEIIDNREKELN